MLHVFGSLFLWLLKLKIENKSKRKIHWNGDALNIVYIKTLSLAWLPLLILMPALLHIYKTNTQRLFPQHFDSINSFSFHFACIHCSKHAPKTTTTTTPPTKLWMGNKHTPSHVCISHVSINVHVIISWVRYDYVNMSRLQHRIDRSSLQTGWIVLA